MQSNRPSAPIFALIALLASTVELASVGAQTTQGDRSEIPGSIDEPDSTHPVRLQISPVGGNRQKKGSILFRVSIENALGEPVWVCVDDWQAPAGILTFDVYEVDGKKVRILKELHVDAPISEDANLKVLDPGDQLSGTMNLNAWSRRYDFKADSYFVVARYFCPFKGSKALDGRSLRIATGKQVSLPSRISLTK